MASKMIAPGQSDRLGLMATKKKTRKKKSTPAKKSVARKSAKTSASAASRRMKAKSSKSRSKVSAPKKKAASKSTPRKQLGRKAAPHETARVFRSSLPTRGESQAAETDFKAKGRGPRSGGQSGDLQGLSDVEGADSESVGELLEEGNSFEAEIVKGVQDAPDADVSEVHSHQEREELDLPEDFREN
jgi:hypothetical protein